MDKTLKRKRHRNAKVMQTKLKDIHRKHSRQVHLNALNIPNFWCCFYRHNVEMATRELVAVMVVTARMRATVKVK